MPLTVARIVITMGSCSLAIYFFLALWTGVREWRQFLFEKRYTPVPRWIDYLKFCLLLLAIPLFIKEIEESVHDWQHADAKSLFAMDFIAFCLLLGLASRRWGSRKSEGSA